jgi:hypothetical protein
MNAAHHAPDSSASGAVRALIERARAAQAVANDYDQQRVDDLVAAAGWAILEPKRNRELAELAVADTGIGNVEDKVRKNYRKTLGLLRDLKGARSVGVIAAYPERGLIELARPAGVVAAITPSTNPAATPANKIINALKGRNAVIVAPSPKGWSTCARLLEFMHAEFDRIGAPRDLVQSLSAPVTKATTAELMRQADLVVATGSQANVRAAYASGTPAFGVGAGNVASIVDETADLAAAGAHPAVEDIRQRDQLLLREQCRAARRDPRRGPNGVAARGSGAARRGRPCAAAGVHVAGRKARPVGQRPVGGRDRGACADRGTAGALREGPAGRGERIRSRASVFGRKTQPGARRLPRARFRRCTRRR